LLPPGVPDFDHYLPVRVLVSIPEEDVASMSGYAGALDRFEKLFERLNGEIP
jgi:hypothetical protein